MRRVLVVLGVCCMLSLCSWSQAAPAAPAAPTKKPTPAKTAARPATAVAAKPTAVIDTTAGKLTCTLFPDKAPIGVANFVGLSRGTRDWMNPLSGKKMHGVPLYDGTIFHRVIPSFMIQGGDPKADGTGDPGYKFANETSSELGFDRPGRLAYANAGPGTNGSQFFVTEVPYPSLNGGYTVFGQCDDASVEVVKQIARMPRDGNDRPDAPVKIKHITITGVASHTAAAHPATKKATPTTPKPATPQPQS
jgi:peptidyl-prolyl cis-trans isomerase A (cyclophilin A)